MADLRKALADLAKRMEAAELALASGAGAAAGGHDAHAVAAAVEGASSVEDLVPLIKDLFEKVGFGCCLGV